MLMNYVKDFFRELFCFGHDYSEFEIEGDDPEIKYYACGKCGKII
jgi:hypothetical protein